MQEIRREFVSDRPPTDNVSFRDKPKSAAVEDDEVLHASAAAAASEARQVFQQQEVETSVDGVDPAAQPFHRQSHEAKRKQEALARKSYIRPEAEIVIEEKDRYDVGGDTKSGNVG